MYSEDKSVGNAGKEEIMRKKHVARMAAWLLSAALLCGQLPTTALAAGTDSRDGTTSLIKSVSDSDNGDVTEPGDETLPDDSTVSDSDLRIIGNDEDGIPNKILYDKLVGIMGGADNLTVGNARQVTNLYLSDFSGDLQNLSKYFTGLESLSIHGSNPEIMLTEADIQEISAIMGLNSLELFDIKAENLNVLGNLHNLTSLTLSNNVLKDISFISADSYPDLTNLSIQNPIYKMPHAFSQMKNLVYLNMANCELRELANLQNLVNLVDLSLYSNYLTQEIIMNNIPDKFTSDSNWMQNTVNPSYDPSLDEYYPENRAEITNDENGIPDKNLYEAMLNEGDNLYDSNQDGKLSVAEARRIHYLNVTGAENLKNLSLFAPNITSLYLYKGYQIQENPVLKKDSLQEITQLTELTDLNISSYELE